MGDKSCSDCCGFYRELGELIRKHNMELLSHTPPNVLASFLRECIRAWNLGISLRGKVWGDVCTVSISSSGGKEKIDD